MKLSTGLSALHPEEFDRVNLLWNEGYPVQLKDRLALFLEEADEQVHFLIRNPDDVIIAWSALVRKQSDWRFSLLVDKEFQGMGFGTRLLEEMKESKSAFTGWVIDHANDIIQDGSVYRSPLNFYLKHGMIADTNRRLETPLISAIEIKWPPRS